MSDVDVTLGNGSSQSMSIPQTGSRWLLVRGRSTSVRLALPSFGSVSIGRGADNDVRVVEPGVADKHLALQLDPAIAVSIFDGDSGILGKSGVERSLSSGAQIRAELGDKLRAGSVEISFLAADSEANARRVWSRAHFETVLAQAPRHGVLRLRGDEAVETALLAAIDDSELVSVLASGEWAVLVSSDERAQAIARAVKPSAMGYSDANSDRLKHAGDRMSAVVKDAGLRTIAGDPAMREVLGLVEQVAASNTHVLILGETGAGKDVVAQMIHDKSDRALSPMLRVSCVELADSFFDGEADGVSKALGGTLLLDEVGGLSLRAQLGLGHLLEKWSLRGDVRVIATSNHDLRGDVKRGAFRKDLYFRLNRVSISIPPLRERSTEIVPLSEMFIASAAETLRRPKKPRLSKEAEAAMLAHRWPGNIRELKNVIERAMLVCAGEVVKLEHLPREVLEGEELEEPVSASMPSFPSLPSASSPSETAEDGEKPGSLRDEMANLERRRITEALDKYPTQTEAAKALDIPLRTFLNRLDALGISRPRKR